MDKGCGCLLLALLMCSCCVSTKAVNSDALPCYTSLGFRHGRNSESWRFHVMTSVGNRDDVRLHSPVGWQPSEPLEKQFVQILTADPLLISGILFQGGGGGGGGHGRITSGSIHLSLDLTTFTTQNFSIPITSGHDDVVSVQLPTMTFARCIRLVPHRSLGQAPRLRLDLLGCTVGRQAACASSPTKNSEESPEVLHEMTDHSHKTGDDTPPTSTDNNIETESHQQARKTPIITSNQKTKNNEEKFNNIKSEQSSSFKNDFKSDKIQRESSAAKSPIAAGAASNGNIKNKKIVPPSIQENTSAESTRKEATENLQSIASSSNQDPSKAFNDVNKTNDTGNDEDKMLNNTVLYNELLVDVGEVESRVAARRENLTELIKALKKNELGCGKKPSSSPHHRHKRVVQGRENTPNEWPWLVSLHYLPYTNFTHRSGFKHLCAANLITPEWLLCAAHCFSDDSFQGLSNVSDWEVYVGIHDQADKDSANVQIRNISMVIVHADSNILRNPFKADVSLIKLDRPVTMTSVVSPICLDDTDLFYKEAMCYISGWGQQSFLNGKGTRFPYTTSLSLLTLPKCKETYDALVSASHEFSSVVYVDDPVICAYGHAGEDACLGDSGGPLMCTVDDQWLLTGLVSGGYECGVKYFPGFYVRISYYFDWIWRQMALYSD